jgi:hypothetical protein
MQVNPSMILVGSKADEDFMDAVTDNGIVTLPRFVLLDMFDNPKSSYQYSFMHFSTHFPSLFPFFLLWTADSTYDFVVKILSTKDFMLENARNKIATLDLLDIPDNLTNPLDRLEYFASLVDFENTHMVY